MEWEGAFWFSLCEMKKKRRRWKTDSEIYYLELSSVFVKECNRVGEIVFTNGAYHMQLSQAPEICVAVGSKETSGASPMIW